VSRNDHCLSLHGRERERRMIDAGTKRRFDR